MSSAFETVWNNSEHKLFIFTKDLSQHIWNEAITTAIQIISENKNMNDECNCKISKNICNTLEELKENEI